MLDRNHDIRVLLPYLRSLLLFSFLESYLVLCIACKLRFLEQSRRPAWTVTCWPSALFLSVAAFWAQLLILLPGTGDVFFDHAIGCNATTTVFVGFHLLVAERQPMALRADVDQETNTESWTASLSNAYALRMCPRRGHRTLRKANAANRRSFLAKLMFHLLGNFVLLDLLNTIAFPIPFFQPTHSKGPRTFRLEELPLSLLHGGMIYAGLNIMYDGYAFLSVSTGNTQPEEWPPLFGDIREAWTAQRAWSRVWHQLMRSHLSSTSAYIIRALPRSLVRNRGLARYVQMCLAFTLSGLLHLAGEYYSLRGTQPPTSLHSHTLRFGGVMATFALQPLGIGFEHLIQFATRSSLHFSLLSPKWRSCMASLMRCIGYLWVIAWYSFSMSFYTRSMMGAGFMTSMANIPRGWTLEALRFVVTHGEHWRYLDVA